MNFTKAKKIVTMCATIASEASKSNGNGGNVPTSEEVKKRLSFARSMSDSGFESKVTRQDILLFNTMSIMVGFR